MSTVGESSIVDALFERPAFAARSDALLLESLNHAYRRHVDLCPPYARFCARRGFSATSQFERYADFPVLPVQAFKEFGDLLRTPPTAAVRARLQSSATSGQPSTVVIDSVTARRQVLALTSVLKDVVGGTRRPFIVCDVDPAAATGNELGARTAAVRGFLSLARDASFVLDRHPGGELALSDDRLNTAIARHRERSEQFAIFGFTYVLYENVIESLLKGPAAPPTDAHLLHIGGWKKLEERSVSRERFIDAVRHVFGISPDRVVDFYGFTEQMGVVYPAVGLDDRRIPAFAHVLVRDPDTHAVLPVGAQGLLQFLTPLPHSYPGLAVLTDDVGQLVERPDGEVRLRVLGRARKAEIRGCGDVLADKMMRPARAASSSRRPELPVLLFHKTPSMPQALASSELDFERLPKVTDLQDLIQDLRASRPVLDTYSFDDIAALVSAAAARWVQDPSLTALSQQGLSFVAQWCQENNLARLGDEALRGSRAALDGFRPRIGGSHRLIKAYPRGIAAHWLAGNVPLLGMLALVQSVLARNANILKCASTHAHALPALLGALRGLEVGTPSGRIVKGDDVLATIAVVYFPKENAAAAEAMSAAADVRVAWGGAEAMSAIGRLPKRYDTEDVLFGPKLSFMALGREALPDQRTSRKLARRVATDASAFDQYACASAHVVFVERGGGIDPKAFAAQLADEMELATTRIPRGAVDAETAARVASIRLRSEFHGTLWSSTGPAWTVIYEDGLGAALPPPTYSRVVVVRSVDDVMAAAALSSSDTQTVGLALDPFRRQQFADVAARRGAHRFPDVGHMTEFDTAWDGVYMLERFVRWVTLGGPS